jgi:hydroxymethylpyrimidine kinase/phosphomethylpyrimidine kinase
MTIAGLDPSGGAGIIADIKTFAAFGCFPTAVAASLTFQNTQGVYGTLDQVAGSIRGQAEPVFRDFTVDAVKTGMLPNREVIEETVELFREFGSSNIVVDPVVRSTSGYDLIDSAALRALTETLFPLADLITPNIPEAERISGVSIEGRDDIIDAAEIMRQMGAANVLIKGGHLVEKDRGNAEMARDFLFLGEKLIVLEGEFHQTSATHGTGCSLAAAIAANLALGNALEESVRIAKDFVNEAIRTAPLIGKGNSPINIQPISRSE